MMLRPGTFLQDRYEVIEQIGSGGMSVVYKAKCHKLNRLVAIKVLKDEFCSDSNFITKFNMEAQAAAGLSHPNIVNVYDVVNEGKLHYIVMELVEGITLKSYIAKKGRLEAKESIGIAIQVAQGIAAAHEQHIVHRDIKPQNMLISRDGKVKVADFGIARAVTSQTMTSAAMGSVHYISPEQARGGFCDERSDIYSLGVTMYEMVTGRVPFDGENTVSIALAHLEDALIPPSVYDPDIPVSLERIIVRCCEKKPEYRYQNVNELITDLREALIHPDGGSVRETARAKDLHGETVVISDGDLAMIKGRVHPETMEEGTGIGGQDYPQELNIIGQGSASGLSDIHTQGKAENEFTDAGSDSARRSKKRQDRDEEEGGTGIERLLAGAGIVVAIIIVAVLIVVVSKLSGLFQSGAGLFGGSTTAAVETESEEYSLSDTEVYMPDVRNLPADIAEDRLSESFLNMKSTYDYFDDVDEGRVASQDPEPDTIVAKGSNVTVVISYGTDKIDLSEFEIDKLDAATAQKLLERKNLTVTLVEEESSTVEAGDVIRYDPELVEEGGTVTLYVSTGPHVDTVEVPDLTGKSESDAIALLAEAGLSPGDTSTEESDTVTKGSVIRQGTAAGTQVEPGSKVSYVVSSGVKVVKQRYVAAINETYDLSNLVGPGAGTSSVTVLIRLRQGSDSNPVYKILMDATTIKGDLLLPVSYTSIESIDGSSSGQVEIVDVDSGEVIKTYALTFLPMD